MRVAPDPRPRAPERATALRWGDTRPTLWCSTLWALAVATQLVGSAPSDARGAPGPGDTPPSATACAVCHGVDGRSHTPGVPSLAGQPAAFLREQLRRFATGQRSSSAMAPIAAGLDEDEAQALAAMYAAMPAPSEPSATDTALMARGRALASLRVCGSCHRRDFSGGGLVPRLAGQREDYLERSLTEYRDHLRNTPDGVMAAAADRMPDGHIHALAHFLAHCR